MAGLSSKTVLVYDYGNYPELGIRLAREFGRVLYFKPWKFSAPRTQDRLIGDGYEEMERVKDFWDIKDEVDLFVFPDIYDGDLQLELERQGKRVWGSRKAEKFEYKRGLFAQTCREAGIPVPEFSKIVGVSLLRQHLQENEDVWIKVEMRGDRETWHHENMKISEPILDALAYFYGPVKEMVCFYVFESLPSEVEPAYDGYMVTSQSGKPQFPKIGFLGYEKKNRAHIVSAVDYEDFPEELKGINDRFAPKLADLNFRSQWGTEVIDGYFLDATCRMPSPPGEIALEIIKNIGEIMYHGSVGELVEMDLENLFGVQVMIYSSWAGSNHCPVQIPDSIRRWVKLSECYRANGIDWIIPKEVEDPVSGWSKNVGAVNVGAVVALGDTIEAAIELVKERCSQITSVDTETQIASLVEVLDRINKGERQGLEFTKQPIPETSVVLAD